MGKIKRLQAMKSSPAVPLPSGEHLFFVVPIRLFGNAFEEFIALHADLDPDADEVFLDPSELRDKGLELQLRLNRAATIAETLLSCGWVTRPAIGAFKDDFHYLLSKRCTVDELIDDFVCIPLSLTPMVDVLAAGDNTSYPLDMNQEVPLAPSSEALKDILAFSKRLAAEVDE